MNGEYKKRKLNILGSVELQQKLYNQIICKTRTEELAHLEMFSFWKTETKRIIKIEIHTTIQAPLESIEWVVEVYLRMSFSESN